MALTEPSLEQPWEGEAPALACSLHQRGLGLLHEQGCDVWGCAVLPHISSPRKLGVQSSDAPTVCLQLGGTWPPDVALGLSPDFHFLFRRRQGIHDRDENLGLFSIVHLILGNFCLGTWQERHSGEGRAEGKRSLLGSFACSAKNGGSSVFPLKIASLCQGHPHRGSGGWGKSDVGLGYVPLA